MGLYICAFLTDQEQNETTCSAASDVQLSLQDREVNWQSWILESNLRLDQNAPAKGRDIFSEKAFSTGRELLSMKAETEVEAQLDETCIVLPDSAYQKDNWMPTIEY